MSPCLNAFPSKHHPTVTPSGNLSSNFSPSQYLSFTSLPHNNTPAGLEKEDALGNAIIFCIVSGVGIVPVGYVK